MEKNQSTEVHKITFNFDELRWENITVEQVKRWEIAYPDLDVIDILTKKMPVWMDANPQKAHKKNFKRFIINWLSSEHSSYKYFIRREVKIGGGKA